VLLHLEWVDSCLSYSENGSLDELEVHVTNQLSEEPEERSLELVVGLGRDVVVLQVLLSVESDLFGLDLSVFDVDFVAHEHDWDAFANSDQVFVPLGNILIGNAGADVEHDDAALATDAANC